MLHYMSSFIKVSEPLMKVYCIYNEMSPFGKNTIGHYNAQI